MDGKAIDDNVTFRQRLFDDFIWQEMMCPMSGLGPLTLNVVGGTDARDDVSVLHASPHTEEYN